MKCDDFNISYINFFMGYEGLLEVLFFVMMKIFRIAIKN